MTFCDKRRSGPSDLRIVARFLNGQEYIWTKIIKNLWSYNMESIVGNFWSIT